MNNVTEWLIQWFLKNTEVEEEKLRTSTGENYFDLGFLDSFAFINFLADMEEYFHIRFSNDEFENRDFMTLTGLTHIIEKRLFDKGAL